MFKTHKFPLTLKPLVVMVREEEGETIVLCASYEGRPGLDPGVWWWGGRQLNFTTSARWVVYSISLYIHYL